MTIAFAFDVLASVLEALLSALVVIIACEILFAIPILLVTAVLYLVGYREPDDVRPELPTAFPTSR